MQITLTNKQIIAARLVVKNMKARSIRPKAETVMIANSVPGTVIEL